MPRWSRGADRMSAALLKPLVPAAAEPMEVVTAHESTVAVEVDADLAPRAAPRAPALIRERRERRDVYRGPPARGCSTVVPPSSRSREAGPAARAHPCACAELRGACRAAATWALGLRADSRRRVTVRVPTKRALFISLSLSIDCTTRIEAGCCVPYRSRQRLSG